ncbi:hypothetical protein CDIK_1454, partial [Cucumispora dikerogammari]
MKIQEPIFYLKETHEFLLEDLTIKSAGNLKPFKYIYYKNTINKQNEQNKQNKDLKNCCYKTNYKETIKNYQITNCTNLLMAIKKGYCVTKYNVPIIKPKYQLPLKYLVSSVYQNHLIICDNEFNFYKYNLNSINQNSENNININENISNNSNNSNNNNNTPHRPHPPTQAVTSNTITSNNSNEGSPHRPHPPTQAVTSNTITSNNSNEGSPHRPH